tara:strand:- start:1155 stop:1796 length:642 start_codon:yes stop_codon:yes gene_type:complete
MIINNFEQLELENKELLAYKTQLNILENKNIIIPHEEIKKNNHITKDIISHSLIVLGVIFKSVGMEIYCKDEMFILDGHHRFEFILENLISEQFNIVLLDINNINIESYNSELLIDKDIFLKKLHSENKLKNNLESNLFIQVEEKKYYLENISSINELYSYKKELMVNNIISPIANDKKTKKVIVSFTPLTSSDFKRGNIFPYKSTWITPRFN